MRSALAVFECDAALLRVHIETLQIEWQLLAAPSSPGSCSPAEALATKLREKIGTGAGKKRFDYNCIIVSMYGLVEQFVEASIREYGQALRSIHPSYQELPEKLQNAHVNLTVQLLGRLEQRRYRDVVTLEQVIANLNSCLANTDNYRLNLEALHQHTANVRSDVCAEMLQRLGVENALARIAACPHFSAQALARFGDVTISALAPSELFAPLDDVAQRRNEVAHGSASELLSNEILLDYLNFLQAFAQGLCELLETEVLAIETQRRGVPLGKPLVVHNHSIVCMNLRQTAIAVGDMLVAKTARPYRPFIGSAIEELQVDNQPVESVEAADSRQVGCRVSFRAKDTYEMFLLRKP